MIRVEVEEYCQECLDFTPDVIKPERTIFVGGEVIYSDTIVQCKNRKRCSNIERYLRQQAKGDNNK